MGILYGIERDSPGNLSKMAKQIAAVRHSLAVALDADEDFHDTFLQLPDLFR